MYIYIYMKVYTILWYFILYFDINFILYFGIYYIKVLEKEMAPHSSVLAWRIPGTGEPGGLPTMGSHRVGHDWSDLAEAAAAAAELCLLSSFCFCIESHIYLSGFPGGSDSKKSACNAGDPGSISGSRRSLGEWNGTPLRCSCLKSSRDRGAWWAAVHEVAKSRTWLKQLSMHVELILNLL